MTTNNKIDNKIDKNKILPGMVVEGLGHRLTDEGLLSYYPQLFVGSVESVEVDEDKMSPDVLHLHGPFYPEDKTIYSFTLFWDLDPVLSPVSMG